MDNSSDWSIKELWEKYENVAMHFNDLLMRLRIQALGGVAAISTLAGLFSQNRNEVNISWGVSALVFVGLSLFWIAVWVIDFRYYNRLLNGAVSAVLSLEELSLTRTHVSKIDLSQKIKDAVEKGSKQFVFRRSLVGPTIFYSIVFIALLSGSVISILGCFSFSFHSIVLTAVFGVLVILAFIYLFFFK